MRDAVAIVQARANSTRLPSKVLMDLCGKPLLTRLFDRLKMCESVVDIICATTPYDTAIHKLCRKEDVKCVFGPEDDVLTRYVIAARTIPEDKLIRVTADCPFLSFEATDDLCNLLGHDIDYANNIDAFMESLIDGCNCEVFWKDTLQRMHRHTTSPEGREHVTGMARTEDHGGFKTLYVDYGPDTGDIHHIQLMVDTQANMDVARFIQGRLEDDSYIELLRIMREYRSEIERMLREG